MTLATLLRALAPMADAVPDTSITFDGDALWLHTQFVAHESVRQRLMAVGWLVVNLPNSKEQLWLLPYAKEAV